MIAAVMHRAAPSRPSLTGTTALVGATLRRDRVRILVWIGAIVLMVAVSAGSTKGLFTTQAELDSAAAASRNPAILAFNGPDQALDTLGGEIAFQIGAPGLVIPALMSLLMVGRWTRGEEEVGRLELVRSLPVGRRAALAAATIVAGAMNVAVGALVAVSMLAIGLPAAGSISFGLAFAMLGLVFVGITLVTAQITEGARMAGGVLAVSYVVRAIGDMNRSGLSWASPIGWVQRARPWAGERWWPFVVAGAASAALVAVAVAMLDRRDLGAGLVEPRPGRTTATRWLGSPLALAVRLQRGTLLGWAVGVALTGLTYGVVTNSIEGFVRDNPKMAEILMAGGGTLVESYLAMSTRIAALIATGFSVQAMLRLRTEETAQRAEPVIAGAVSHRRWAWSHVAVALAGSALLLGLLGLTLGISAAGTTGDAGLAPRVLGAAIAYVPAMWLFVGSAIALAGVVPRIASAAWGAMAIAFVVAMFGAVLNLPGWITGLSPFEHMPLLPAHGFSGAPVAMLLAIAIGLIAIGIAGIGRRDIG